MHQSVLLKHAWFWKWWKHCNQILSDITTLRSPCSFGQYLHARFHLAWQVSWCSRRCAANAIGRNAISHWHVTKVLLHSCCYWSISRNESMNSAWISGNLLSPAFWCLLRDGTCVLHPNLIRLGAHCFFIQSNGRGKDVVHVYVAAKLALQPTNACHDGIPTDAVSACRPCLPDCLLGSRLCPQFGTVKSTVRSGCPCYDLIIMIPYG